MEKIKISINQRDLKNHSYSKTLGMDYILGLFAKSNLFDVSFHNDSISAFRGNRATLIYIGNKKVYLDFWEYATPTHTNEVVNANLDLIIKLQHRQFTLEHYNWFCNKKNMLIGIDNETRKKFLDKIVPFTFFPSRLFIDYIGREKEIENLPIEREGFFCGKNWRCRNVMSSKLKQEGMEYFTSDQGEIDGKTISDEEFLKKMKGSKYGVVLAGRATAITDAKNRREIDYILLKKPLLLNYRPYYYNPLVDGKHYIYIDANTDCKNLDKMYNIDDIVKNATDWYWENASVDGVVNLFVKILKERKIL